jgi:hypothetical protein
MLPTHRRLSFTNCSRVAEPPSRIPSIPATDIISARSASSASGVLDSVAHIANRKTRRFRRPDRRTGPRFPQSDACCSRLLFCCESLLPRRRWCVHECFGKSPTRSLFGCRHTPELVQLRRDGIASTNPWTKRVAGFAATPLVLAGVHLMTTGGTATAAASIANIAYQFTA